MNSERKFSSTKKTLNHIESAMMRPNVSRNLQRCGKLAQAAAKAVLPRGDWVDDRPIPADRYGSSSNERRNNRSRKAGKKSKPKKKELFQNRSFEEPLGRRRRLTEREDLEMRNSAALQECEAYMHQKERNEEAAKESREKRVRMKKERMLHTFTMEGDDCVHTFGHRAVNLEIRREDDELLEF